VAQDSRFRLATIQRTITEMASATKAPTCAGSNETTKSPFPSEFGDFPVIDPTIRRRLEQLHAPRYHLKVFTALSVAEKAVTSQGTVARNHTDAPVALRRGPGIARVRVPTKNWRETR
jgi:hypothetical protein